MRSSTVDRCGRRIDPECRRLTTVADGLGQTAGSVDSRPQDLGTVRRGIATIDALTGEVHQQVRSLEEIGDRRRVVPRRIRSPTPDQGDAGTLAAKSPGEVLADEAGCPGDHDSVGGRDIGHGAFSIL